MEIRYKFRSSQTFDTIDIGQQSSISLRDLKSIIVLKKHLNLCLDFDLVFSDFTSGEELKDENTRIPSGSSVIIKRVPAKSPPLLREVDDSAGHVGGRDAYSYFEKIVEPPVLDFGVNEFNELDDFGVNELDDFGVDLCPPPVAKKSDSWIRRCCAKPQVKGEKLEATLPTQSNPKDSRANEGSTFMVHFKPIAKEQTKFERAVAVKNVAVESFDMPSELKCSLCTTFFKEAVMIPCCQHSFCEKCIRQALVEKSRCPMCSSTKCKPADLLPNLSLRQTVERFLESQRLQNGFQKDLDRYAPDGESGIQMRELSYAATVQPRDLQLNRSATKVSAKLLGETKCEPVALEDCTEFQGENEPLKTAGANEEANSVVMKGQDIQSATGGGERNLIAPGRHSKGLRTCFMCGSPDHLIRDCPAAASSRAGSWSGNVPVQGVVPGYAPEFSGNVPFQGVVPGYAPEYWSGNPPHGRPLYDPHCGPEMMLYNTNMAPATPFAFSPYASPMFSGYPPTSGPLQQGVMPPLSGMNAHQMHQTNFRGLVGCANQRGSHTEAFKRGEVFDRDHNVNKHLDDAKRGPNHSNGSFTRRAEGNHKSHEISEDNDKYSNGKGQERLSRSSEGGRNSRNDQVDKSTSEKAMPDSRTRPLVERHENSHRCSKRKEEMRAHDGDSSQIHEHERRRRRDKSSPRRRMEHDRRSDREFYSHSGPGLEPSYSSGDGRRREDKSSPRSRHSKKNSKPNGKDIYHDRGRMTKYSDDDYADDYHSHKRKRYH